MCPFSVLTPRAQGLGKGVGCRTQQEVPALKPGPTGAGTDLPSQPTSQLISPLVAQQCEQHVPTRSPAPSPWPADGAGISEVPSRCLMEVVTLYGVRLRLGVQPPARGRGILSSRASQEQQGRRPGGARHPWLSAALLTISLPTDAPGHTGQAADHGPSTPDGAPGSPGPLDRRASPPWGAGRVLFCLGPVLTWT